MNELKTTAPKSLPNLSKMQTQISTVVKPVRLSYAVLFVILLIAVYLLIIHPWMTDWGSTPAEQQMTLPGDDLIPEGARKSTLAITIDAKPEVIWQWLVQVGQDRGGFYSYTWLANLLGADIHNADEIHPEWQKLAVGDGWRTVPADYLWGVGKEAKSPVLMIEPGRTLVLEMFGAHVILPIDEHTSRLIVRSQATPPSPVFTMIVDPIIFTMERRMLLGLKARAEGRSDAHEVFMVIAQLGWAAAGVAVAFLFLGQRKRRYWLALPIVAALPALLMSRDIQAGLAAFLAVGITTLGFLIFGRIWWGSFLIIGSIVLLTLLLASNAYIVIGLAFVLLILAALGVMVTARP